MNILPFGDQAVILEFGKEITEDIHKQVIAWTDLLEDLSPEWMIEYIPAFTTVTIFYDPYIISTKLSSRELPFQYLSRFFQELQDRLLFSNKAHSRVVEIPVCYGGEMGSDINFVAEINGLTIEEVINIHSSCEYLVYMIGFAPGFPYLGGMSERIATPRKKTPRLKIPERSVGIAGRQTGIYPIETPGGWQLIGRTPLRLFRPEEENPSLLKAGDKIRFKPISLEEYMEWEHEG